MKHKREKPLNTHPPAIAQAAPCLDPQWEVIDKGGVPRLPEAFGDAFEAVEATETSAPVAPSQRQPNPVSSPLDFATTSRSVGCDDLDAMQRMNDQSSSPQARSRPDVETRPGPGGYEDRMDSLPKGDEPPPTPARRRQSKPSSGPRAGRNVEPKPPHRFPRILAERTSKGTKFSLSDGASVRTSIQANKERVCARVVRCALCTIQLAYQSQGWSFSRARVPRVQLLAIRLCEVLALQDLEYPDVPLHEFITEAFTALFNIQDALEKLSDVSERR